MQVPDAARCDHDRGRDRPLLEGLARFGLIEVCPQRPDTVEGVLAAGVPAACCDADVHVGTQAETQDAPCGCVGVGVLKEVAQHAAAVAVAHLDQCAAALACEERVSSALWVSRSIECRNRSFGRIQHTLVTATRLQNRCRNCFAETRIAALARPGKWGVFI
jgi:hypothetical protein